MHKQNRFKLTRYIHFFFRRYILTYDLVVHTNLWLSGEGKSQWVATWIQFPQACSGCWNSLLPLARFVWHWTRECTDKYTVILLHSEYFFFNFFNGRLSRADRVICEFKYENVTSIFEALGVRPWARTWPHVCAWHMGVNIAICSIRTKLPENVWKGLAIVFLELWKIPEKHCPHWGFSTLIPQTRPLNQPHSTMST